MQISILVKPVNTKRKFELPLLKIYFVFIWMVSEIHEPVLFHVRGHKL